MVVPTSIFMVVSRTTRIYFIYTSDMYTLILSNVYSVIYHDLIIH